MKRKGIRASFQHQCTAQWRRIYQAASIPSAFVERRVQFETSKPFNIRRSVEATTDICAQRFRLCLPHISHACQSKFDLRASCRAGITKNTDGNPKDSPRPIAVNKLDEAKSDICARNRKRVRAQSRFRSTKNRNDSTMDRDSEVVLRQIYAIHL